MKRKIDPKKPKYPPTTNPAKGTSGSAAQPYRDSKGNLKAKIGKDFGGVSQETLKQDKAAKAGTGSGTYTGAPAPRVGGKPIAKSSPLKSATKKVIKQSRRKPTGSPQAKAAQKRNNRF